jgi:hypothetical protein
MSKLKKKVVKDGDGKPIGYYCEEKGIYLALWPNKEASRIITDNHYAKRPTSLLDFSFLVFWYGEVHGALQIGRGIQPKAKGGLPPETTREFDRMWLSDAMPKYSETIVISLLIHFLREATNLTHLISWADGSAGNVGTIYKAANFKFLKQKPVDFYLHNGERIHPLRLYHRHGTRAWAFLSGQYPGITKLKGVQRQFVYEIKR